MCVRSTDLAALLSPWSHVSQPQHRRDGFACTPHWYFQLWIKTEFALWRVNGFLFQEEEEEVALRIIANRPKETWWLKKWEKSPVHKQGLLYIWHIRKADHCRGNTSSLSGEASKVVGTATEHPKRCWAELSSTVKHGGANLTCRKCHHS